MVVRTSTRQAPLCEQVLKLELVIGFKMEKRSCPELVSVDVGCNDLEAILTSKNMDQEDSRDMLENVGPCRFALKRNRNTEKFVFLAVTIHRKMS